MSSGNYTDTRPPADNNGEDASYEPSNECCNVTIVAISYVLAILLLPFSLICCLKVVREYQRAVILRLGRFRHKKAGGPGMYVVMPCTDRLVSVDVRTLSLEIAPQEVLTNDSVTITVDAVVYYRVVDAIRAVRNVNNRHVATRLLTMTALRNIIGNENLSDILSDRQNITRSIQEQMEEVTKDWGVRVQRVEIKDVRLPADLQRSMAAEAEAAREARAKVIAAEGEQRASRALKEAADVISQSPSALQLRYLQTLTHIAAEKNSTIIFPLPIELLKGNMSGKL